MMSGKKWMVRSGEGGYLFEEFQKFSIVAIGWNEIGKLNQSDSLDDIKKKIRITYPEYKDGQIISSSTQIHKFLTRFAVGDSVVTYNKQTRNYMIGQIDSDYFFEKNTCEYYHQRKVKWTENKNRDELSADSKNTLGSTLTIFEINDDVFHDLTHKKKVETEIIEEDLEEIREDVVERAHEFIKDKLSKLSWDAMQDFVAGLLRAMGYKTKVSERGPDRGKDITASPDGLGLEEPRIKVEVKHRTGQMGSQEIRSFIGSLRSEKGLYVSTGGFSKDAKYEAERSDKPLTLIDLDTLVEITIQYYDSFDTEARALLPLKKMYWPL
jgi:restriction system protein